jgi:ubiquitin-conjugating enzyme E2 Q
MQMLEDSLIPSGLALSVPHPGHDYTGWNGEGVAQMAHYPVPVNNARTPAPVKPTKIKINCVESELMFEHARGMCPFKVNAWIVINIEKEPARHCRVIETCCYPTIKFSQPIIAAVEDKDKHRENLAMIDAAAKIPAWKEATFHVYDQNFDDLLTRTDKFRTLQLLMDLLPSVDEMKTRIETYNTLVGWDRLSPACLGCLRWIISSNRSCIMQVDEGSEIPATREPRIPGFAQWVQFRFASGSPDKEQRFVEALKAETSNLQHPSIFAW